MPEPSAATMDGFARGDQYAVRLGVSLPVGLFDLDPTLPCVPGGTERSEDWYVVVKLVREHDEGDPALGIDPFDVETALIVDVRRMDWELPEGVTDARHV